MNRHHIRVCINRPKNTVPRVGIETDINMGVHLHIG